MLRSPLLKLLSFIFVSILMITLVSCGEEKKPTAPTSTNIVIKQEFKDKVADKKNSDEYMLLETSCLYCHTIGSVKETEVAPTMRVIRDVYKQAYPTKEAFIKSFQEFCENPVAEKSLMPSAIEQYGLMEDAGHIKEDVEDIAAYLFDYKF